MYLVCPAVILHGGQSAHLHAPKAVLVANFSEHACGERDVGLTYRMCRAHISCTSSQTELAILVLGLLTRHRHSCMTPPFLPWHNMIKFLLLRLPCHTPFQVLEHNSHLQQQLQELSHATHAAQAPAQASTTTSMQASLLRAALAEANYRLTAAGLLPVAATSLQRSQQQVRGLLHTQHIMYFTWVQPCW